MKKYVSSRLYTIWAFSSLFLSICDFVLFCFDYIDVYDNIDNKLENKQNTRSHIVINAYYRQKQFHKSTNYFFYIRILNAYTRISSN